MRYADVLKTLSMVLVAVALGACATQKEKETPPPPAPEAPKAEAPVEPTAAPAPAPVVAPVSNLPTNYEVVRGDNLWNIAGQSRIYGNPYQWPLIYKANSGKIKDADLIYPGQNFDINRSASAAEIDAAVQHAKTRGAWSLGTVEPSDKAYLSH
jgi:nucleoid-associated protein YgaU